MTEPELNDLLQRHPRLLEAYHNNILIYGALKNCLASDLDVETCLVSTLIACCRVQRDLTSKLAEALANAPAPPQGLLQHRQG